MPIQSNRKSPLWELLVRERPFSKPPKQQQDPKKFSLTCSATREHALDFWPIRKLGSMLRPIRSWGYLLTYPLASWSVKKPVPHSLTALQVGGKLFWLPYSLANNSCIEGSISAYWWLWVLAQKLSNSIGILTHEILTLFKFAWESQEVYINAFLPFSTYLPSLHYPRKGKYTLCLVEEKHVNNFCIYKCHVTLVIGHFTWGDDGELRMLMMFSLSTSGAWMEWQENKGKLAFNFPILSPM